MENHMWVCGISRHATHICASALNCGGYMFSVCVVKSGNHVRVSNGSDSDYEPALELGLLPVNVFYLLLIETQGRVGTTPVRIRVRGSAPETRRAGR